jgi:hypothetical protein
MSGDVLSSWRNSRVGRTRTRTGVVAVTVAVRGTSVISAISPRKSPPQSDAITCPLRCTLALPSRITKNSRPRVPSFVKTRPAGRSISSASWAIWTSWRLEHREKRGTREIVAAFELFPSLIRGV